MAKAAVMAMGVLAVVLAMACAAEAGKEYEVKWDFPTGDKFFSAVQGKTYFVGDTLKFTYMQEMHNVVRVDEQDFNDCKPKPLSPEYADGQTSLPLNKPGAHYFICSIEGHCADGMKIKVIANARPRKLAL